MTGPIIPTNPDWYNTALDFVCADMRAHPSTDAVFDFFTEDAEFYLKPGGKCFSKNEFKPVYRISCENDVEALGPRTINIIDQPVNGEDGYLTWKLSGLQYRLGCGRHPKGWYAVSGENQLYFKKEGERTLICKIVSISSIFKEMGDKQEPDEIVMKEKVGAFSIG